MTVLKAALTNTTKSGWFVKSTALSESHARAKCSDCAFQHREEILKTLAMALSSCSTLKKATNIFLSKLDLTMLSLPPNLLLSKQNLNFRPALPVVIAAVKHYL